MDADGRIAAPWFRDHQLWIELFVVANFAGLVARHLSRALDRTISARDSEYIPLFFSAAAAVPLACVAPAASEWPAAWRDVGHLVGWLAIVVGLAGVVLHLDSRSSTSERFAA